MPNPIVLIQGSLLQSTVATFYTVPSTDAKIKAVVLTSVRFVNTDSWARTFTLYIVPKGATAGDANTRFKTISIPAAGDPDSSQFYIMADVMLPGTKLQALASAADKVAFSANGESSP